MQLTALFVMYISYLITQQKNILLEHVRLSWFSLNWVHLSQNDGKSCKMWICFLYSIVLCKQGILAYLALITRFQTMMLLK
jgi:hypothetical protein